MNELDPEEIEDSLILDRDLEEPQSTGQLGGEGEARLKRLPTDMEEQIVSVLKAVRRVQPDAIPDKQRRSEVLLSVMQRVFELRLAGYATSEEEDGQLLAHQASGPLPARRRMAAVVRRGEKALLREAADVARKQLAELSSGTAEGEPASKKQRRQ